MVRRNPKQTSEFCSNEMCGHPRRVHVNSYNVTHLTETGCDLCNCKRFIDIEIVRGDAVPEVVK